MSDPRRWALALAAIETRFEPSDLVVGDRGKHRKRLAELSPSVGSKQQLIEYVEFRIDRDAYDVVHAIVAVVHGVRAGLLDETSAWQLILRAAANAQRRYASWKEFGDGFAGGFYDVTDGRASCEGDVEAFLRDRTSPWCTLPWDVDLDPPPIRQRFCLAIGAPVIRIDGGDPRQIGGVEYHARGAVEIADRFGAKLRDSYAITTRAELLAWTRTMLGGKPRAYDLSRAVATLGWAVRADLMTEEDSWHVMLVAGKLAQQTYTSWDDFAADYLRAWDGPAEPITTHIAELQTGLWSTLPWTTDLEVTVFDPVARPRVLRVACSRCGAPRTRPSQTAFIYCDFCGELVDYDLARACEQPLQRPGPAYETLRAELAPALATARDALDREAYHALQLRLFDVWLDACPTAVPIRVGDAEYRARYVAWLAAGDTAAAFDPESRTLETAVHVATAKLGFAEIDGRPRVVPESYREMCEAVFAYEARRDAVFVERGIYALHPDGASRDLLRRIGNSLFVQGWLPFLDESDARALLERTEFVREYVALEPPPSRATTCASCGAPIQLLDGARRVVCETCGRHVDVTGSR